ncbi:hypothetical protein BGX34_000326 [Mortierella sp. NVP85]|nr:hypothetical protein BGX34_000326 [Mortierella sp. NVP85]
MFPRNQGLAGRLNAKENATHLIKDAKDTEQDINIETRKAVHFLKCENCTYTVKGTLIKLTIEECKNVVIKIEDKILTGTVDLFKSDNVSFSVKAISLLSLENTKSVKIRFQDPEHFGSMVWSGDDDLQLHLGDDLHSFSYSELQLTNPNLNPAINQFKTTLVNGDVRTEAVIRIEGGGFPMTRAEENDHIEAERNKEEALRGGQQPEGDA